ncbi:PAS domain-containing hybrid sensor histidine kinase/response regulator [Noviherbaspirillum pedocola]|uniref:histidine kinase n=1 Tax=Noviherbaspirillum pedocola TaxID=2801341 RepID=A0A934SZ19_9BURK|nr:ATP-binding protein [Noviherbaspirillum pedocola]MBK4735299.1 PAS domain-containing protein [Noviherbaspirillum pedocola]
MASVILLIAFAFLYAVWRRERKRHQLLARDHARLQADHDTMEGMWIDAPLGLAILDRELRYVRINRLLADINGLSIEEHAGKSLREIVPDLAPQVEELFLNVIRTAKPLLGIVIGGETSSQPGVERFWRENVYPIMSTHGRVLGLKVTIEECTEQKRLDDALRASEQRERQRAMELETVMNAAPAGIFITHSTTCSDVAINAEAMRMLRREASEQLSLSCPGEKNYQIFANGELREASSLPLQVAAASGMAVRGQELELRFHDGAVMSILANAVPLHDREGVVTGAVAAFVDITAQKMASDMLQQDSQRKDQFIATLAHELRNPLAAIRTGLDLMKVSPTSLSLVTRTRDIMERQLGHLVRLIDDLLDVSRINTGKLEMRREPMSLAEVIDNALEVNAPFIEDSGHTLEVSVIATPLYIEADRVRIEQVLTNVLHNAAKYTPAGGKVTVTVTEAAGEAIICIADNGIGIDPIVLPSLFDIFSQAEAGRDLRKGGIGIGLSLARKLVELHGGKLTASSDGIGKGSTFTIRLPLCEVPIIKAPASASSASTHGPMQTQRILIVDDNTDAALTLASLLETCGHRIATAHTGTEAIASAKTFYPDIVFLDIGLPDISGLDIARMLRREERLRNAKLVALTGWGSVNDRTATKEAGFDLHFTKPINIDALRLGLPELKLPLAH